MDLKFFQDAWLIIRKAFYRFNDNDPITLAGALAFFSIFAAPPILIMIIFLVGLITGQDLASREVFEVIRSSAGTDAAELIRNIVKNYFVEDISLFQQIVSVTIFLFAASTYFIIIQKSLNQIWGVESQPENQYFRVFRDRLVSFTLIFLMGVIFILSFIIEMALVFLGNNLDHYLPGIMPILINIVGYFVSFLAVMFILGMIYKFLPDVVIEWKVVWVGAAVTSFLFSLGKIVITFGLSQSNIDTMYGAAGSTAIFLLWVFYSSIILFFGAEITQQYARSFGENIQPKEHAVKITTKVVDEDRDPDT